MSRFPSIILGTQHRRFGIQDKGTSPGNSEPLYWPIDLGDPQGVKKSAQEFLEKEQRLDVLSESFRFAESYVGIG